MSYLLWPLSPASMFALGTQLLAVLQQESPSGSPLEDSIRIVFVSLTVLTGVGIIFLVGSFFLSKTPFFRHMTLSTVQATHQGYTAQTYSANLIGLQGTAQTPLRPAGKAMIRDVCYDVRTLGTYVASGAAVVVTSVEGTSLVVQAIRQA